MRIAAIMIGATFAAAPAAAETLYRGVSDDEFWAPHQNDPIVSADSPGAVPEALTAIFEGAGLKWAARIYPELAEARAAFNRGELDFEVTSLSWVEQPVSDGSLFSSAFYVVADRLLFAESTPPVTADCAAMGALPLWGVVGYRYPCGGELRIHRTAGESALVEGVAKGVFAAAIVEETTAKFWARRLGVPLRIGPVVDMAELRLRFRDPRPRLLDRINASIGRVLRFGAIDAIRARYVANAATVQIAER